METTAIILAKNEEANLERVLKSVSFCKEIIVVDDGSTDKTAEIARQHKARVVKGHSAVGFAALRNRAMEESKTDWVLFVDADEEVSPDLCKQIQETTPDASISAYYIKRRDFWWGRELRYGEVSKVRNSGLIRLMKKGTGAWKGQVHEAWETTGSTRTMEGFLNHYPHPTLKEFLSSINLYTDLRAHELKEQGVKPNMAVLLLYPAGKFLLNYFVYLGFLDGPAGFAYAFLMSFHSFLVRAKLYQYTEIDQPA